MLLPQPGDTYRSHLTNPYQSALTHITSRTHQAIAASPLFFNLPAELRNITYCYVLAQGTLTFERKKKYNPVQGKPYKCRHSYTFCDALRTGSTRPDLACLLVCRQIHHEANLLPFALNRFHFISLPAFDAISRRLSRPQRGAIKVRTCNIGTLQDRC
tara:strand:+ start:405 stop:878 length:474 start_codon:yes stop_codon:yes gene_type:complete